MSNWRWMTTTVILGTLLLNVPAAQSQLPVTATVQSDLLSVVYVSPDNLSYQEIYDLLRQHNALEKIKEILSPFRFHEQLTIETTECGAVNSYYQRKNFKPTVTIC